MIGKAVFKSFFNSSLQKTGDTPRAVKLIFGDWNTACENGNDAEALLQADEEMAEQPESEA